MECIESKMTSKGQISVPAVVRRQLDLAPGTRIEWSERDGEVIIRRASRFSSHDIHTAVFGEKQRAISVAEMDVGIRAYMKDKYVGR